MVEVWFCSLLSRSHLRGSSICMQQQRKCFRAHDKQLATTRTALVTELLIHVKWSMAFNWKVHGLIWISCLPDCSAFPRSEIVLWNLLQLFGSRALNCSARFYYFSLHLFASRVFSRAAPRKPEGIDKEPASAQGFDEKCISISRIIIYRKLKCDVALCGGD